MIRVKSSRWTRFPTDSGARVALRRRSLSRYDGIQVMVPPKDEDSFQVTLEVQGINWMGARQEGQQ